MKEELKCPECGSSQTKFRVKTNNRICYTCGHIYTIEVENAD